MAIFKTSNATPSLEEIDVSVDNEFKVQINTSGESVKGYSLQVWSGDGKDLLYETINRCLQPSEYVGNKEVLSFIVTAEEFSSHGIVNGKEYLWGVRVYNEVPNGNEYVSNTLVCEGYIVGSTKYVIWAKINPEEDEDALNQIVYDRYIEIEADKSDINIGGNPSDEDRIRYKNLPDGPYRERQKIDWVTKEIGSDKSYVKIELTDPFTYNYKNGTQFKIYKTSDKHTVNSAFADPNSNINVSDWVVIYKSAEEAKQAADAGDTPDSIVSGISPIFPAKKITGYSSDTGEIRVHDAWTSAPVNGQAYRIFVRDPDTRQFDEYLNSDLVNGVTKGAKYYEEYVGSGENYYYSAIENNRPAGRTWQYYTSMTGCIQGIQSERETLSPGTSYPCELYSSGDDGVSRFSIKSYYVESPQSTSYYMAVIPSGKGFKYYSDPGLGVEAGTVATTSTDTYQCELVSQKSSMIQINGVFYYVSNNDVTKCGNFEQDYPISSSSSFTGNVIYTHPKDVNTVLKGCTVKLTCAATNAKAYSNPECTGSYQGLSERLVCLESEDLNSYLVAEPRKVGKNVYYTKKYVKTTDPAISEEDYLVLTSKLKYNSSYGWLINKVRDNSSVYAGQTSATTSYLYSNATCSTIRLEGGAFNVFTPEPKTITTNDFYIVNYGKNSKYGTVTIDSKEYFVGAEDIKSKYGDEYITNPYDLQVIGGRPITNSEFKVLNNNFSREEEPSDKNRLFIQPNVNIKTDIEIGSHDEFLIHGIPNQLAIEATDGSLMRLSIVKNTTTDSLGKEVDTTINRLDDTQWMLEGSAIDDSSTSSVSKIPKIEPQTPYKIYTSFADTMPLNLFYARSSPEITFTGRNAYDIGGKKSVDFIPMKDITLKGIFSYRIEPGASYFNTYAEPGTPVYIDRSCQIRGGTLNIRRKLSPLYYEVSDSDTTSFSCVMQVIDETSIEKYVKFTSCETISSSHEYPVLAELGSDDDSSHYHFFGVYRTDAFLITSVEGNEICIPYYNFDSEETDEFGNCLIHKFSEDEGKYVSYSIENYNYTYVYAKTTLASMGRQVFYFMPPVYNFRDIEFKAVMTYPETTNTESSYPSIKFYHYFLYDKNGILIKESDDIYASDLTWTFKGLDEGENMAGTSDNINKYTVSILIVDEYNRNFTKSSEFGVYYPTNRSEVPLKISFDCGEGAILIKTEEPMQAISTDLGEKSTVVNGNIVDIDAENVYLNIPEEKILNYDSFNSGGVEDAIYFPDATSVLSQFNMTREKMNSLYQESVRTSNPEEEAVVFSYGHKHVNGDLHEYCSKLATQGTASVDFKHFCEVIKDYMVYSDDRQITGRYSILKDTGKWYIEKVDDIYYDTTLAEKGIEFEMGVGHGLHSSDFIDFKMGMVGTRVQILTTGGYPLAVFRDSSYISVSELTDTRRELLENFLTRHYLLEEGGPIKANAHFIMDYSDGNWSYYYSPEQLEGAGGMYMSLNELGIAPTNVQSSEIGDVLVLTKSSSGVIIREKRFYDEDFDVDVENCSLDNGIYFLRKQVSDSGTTTSASYEWFVYKISDRRSIIFGPEQFSVLSEYGISSNFHHSTSTTGTGSDDFINKNDYLMVTLKNNSGEISASVVNRFDRQSIIPSDAVDAEVFLARMRALFPQASEDSLYTQYILVYKNGSMNIKKLKKRGTDVTNPIPEEGEVSDIAYIGITIENASGDNVNNDFVDLFASTSELLELRYVVPCRYFSVDGVLVCNGYAGCFRLYDVSDSSNPKLVQNCFVNDGNTPEYNLQGLSTPRRGNLVSYFSLGDSIKGEGINLIARDLIKTPIQQNNGDFVAIMSSEDYIYHRERFNEDIVYIVTTEIPADISDLYHVGAITPGIYGYNPSRKSPFGAGSFEKKSEPLMVYISNSDELPVNSLTGQRVSPAEVADGFAYFSDPTQESPYRCSFVYSDNSSDGEPALWVDYLPESGSEGFSDYDDIWIKFFMIIDDQYEGQSQSSQGNSRITIGLKPKRGGMWGNG